MKILIVGAGPVGCYAAQLLKERGYKPIVLEEHPNVGKPVQCAGIVSSKLISTITPYISEEAILRKVDGFVINTPWTEEFTINVPQIACIVNRERFDIDIGRGLDIRLGRRVTRITRENKGYCVYTNQKEEFEADVLIGADGPDSIVRKYLLNIYNSKSNNNEFRIIYYYGMQYQIKLKETYSKITNGFIQVYFDKDIPFFLWVIPESSRVLRVGVVGIKPGNAKKLLDDYIDNKKIEGKISDVVAGKIAIGYIPTYSDSIALVGDAACQMKPLTGGGLSFGIKSAKILADCIAEHKLEEYDSIWKRNVGKEINFGLRAREIYEQLDEAQKKKVFLLFKKNSAFIEQAAEFDNHSRLFSKALKNPQLLLDAGKLLVYYLENMLK